MNSLQVAVPAAPVRSLDTSNMQVVNLERGQGDDAMQVRRPNFGQRWAESVHSVPYALSDIMRPAPQAPEGQPIVHRVGDGHGFAKGAAIFFGLIGFCAGYGFSTMAGEQLLLGVASNPFNPSGSGGHRTLATSLIGFNLPLGIAGLGVGAAVGAGLGALVDACVEN